LAAGAATTVARLIPSATVPSALPLLPRAASRYATTVTAANVAPAIRPDRLRAAKISGIVGAIAVIA
jgi:hypothetical protein